MLSHGFEAKVFGIAFEIWGLDRLKNLGLHAQRQGFMRWSLYQDWRYQKLFCRGPNYIGLHAKQWNSVTFRYYWNHSLRYHHSINFKQTADIRMKIKGRGLNKQIRTWPFLSMSWYTHCYPHSINSWARLTGWLHHSTELLKAVLAKAQSQYIHQLQRPWEYGIMRNAASRNKICY